MVSSTHQLQAYHAYMTHLESFKCSSTATADAACSFAAGPKVSLRRREQRPLSATSNSSAAAATGGFGHASAAAALQLQLHEVIGQGTFGVVYRATWRGIPAAVKVVQLPGVSSMEGSRKGSRQEQMAIMETALGSSISHPNIVQASALGPYPCVCCF